LDAHQLPSSSPSQNNRNFGGTGLNFSSSVKNIKKRLESPSEVESNSSEEDDYEQVRVYSLPDIKELFSTLEADNDLIAMKIFRKIQPITILQGLKCTINEKVEIFKGEIAFNMCELNVVQFCIFYRAIDCLKSIL
jgi:hypothetical protein